jgi:C4-dicarboxylate-specific signal transduction histidine kinase
VVLVGVSLFTFYTIAKTNLENAIYAHLATTAQSRAHNIETYLEEGKARLALLAESVLIEDTIKEINLNSPNSKESSEDLSLILKDFAKAEKEAYELLILNPDGKIIASTNEENIGADKSSDVYFLAGKEKTYIKDAYYSETTRKETYAVSTPVRDDNTKELLGVLVGRFGMTDLNRITTERTCLGETGELYLVNKYGYMITPSRFKENTFLKQKVDTISFRNCLSMAEHPEMHIVHLQVGVFPDYRDVMVLGTHEYISEMQWSLLAEIDEKEALAPLDTMKLIFIIIFCAIPAVVWTVGMLVSRAITAPIHRLHRGTEIIGEGDLDYKVGTDAKDEIGQLSRAFDKMTNDLKSTTTSIENLNKEITERKKAEQNLQTAQKKLIDTARQVGMAETATDVLHNVGNVLNSVSVTTASIRKRVHDSKVSYLTEVVGLLEEHADDLSTFMTTEERGRKLPAFLANLSKELIAEQERCLEALETLTKHVEHMAEIIQLQQSYSKTTSMVEPASVVELVEDAIHINAEALIRHGVEVKREFADLPPVLLDHHKVLQILTNLISNAKYALSDSGQDDKILTICVTEPQGGHFRIEVHDNGVGITEENLARIFEHGFTTKKHGYGFGLHSAAIAAKEMNGSLTAHSDGPGKGTVFILELPFQTQEAVK